MKKKEKKQLIERLLAAAKDEIRITYNKSDDELSALDSRIGGKPAVPQGFVWPCYSGLAYGESERKSRPLSFMAQINLKDIAELDKDNLLPKSGILSFFYELETMTWGFEPKDKGSARVFYFPDESCLSIADYPDGFEDDAKLPEFSLEFEQHISIPDYDDYEDGSDYDLDDYYDCRDECGYEQDEWGDYTKLFGYPDIIQNSMEEECEAVTRGFSLGNSEDYAKIPEDVKADISAKSSEWVMLFQMGTISDDDFELMFGDCGHIYFWIKKSDLQNRNFDDVWLILQCS